VSQSVLNSLPVARPGYRQAPGRKNLRLRRRSCSNQPIGRTVCCHRHRHHSLVSCTGWTVENMTADRGDPAETWCPVRRDVVGVVMCGTGNMQRIASIERTFCDDASGIHDGHRQSTPHGPVTCEAELASRFSFGTGKHNATYRFWIGRVAQPVDHDFGDRLLARQRFVSGLVSDCIGKACDGALAISAVARPNGSRLRHRGNRDAQQCNASQQGYCATNPVLPKAASRTALDKVDCTTATICSRFAMRSDYSHNRQSAAFRR
jgi:hypothetical protein